MNVRIHHAVRLAALIGVAAGPCLQAPAACQPPLTNYQTFVATNDFDLNLRFEVYDPARDTVMVGRKRYSGDSLEYWVLQSLASQQGIVTWSVATAGALAPSDIEIGFALYDPAR